MNAARPKAPLCLILLDYVAPLDAVDAQMQAHVAWLEQGIDQGVFLVAGRRAPRSGGVILVRGHKAEVAALAQSDPFVTSGVAKADVVEFSASFASAGFAALLHA